MDKEQIVHDLALIVVENVLEDIDEEYGIKQYSKQAAEIYKAARDIIEKELD